MIDDNETCRFCSKPWMATRDGVPVCDEHMNPLFKIPNEPDVFVTQKLVGTLMKAIEAKSARSGFSVSIRPFTTMTIAHYGSPGRFFGQVQ
jgi:hypothetical protein